jgi:hypothetical protein
MQNSIRQQGSTSGLDPFGSGSQFSHENTFQSLLQHQQQQKLNFQQQQIDNSTTITTSAIVTTSNYDNSKNTIVQESSIKVTATLDEKPSISADASNIRKIADKIFNVKKKITDNNNGSDNNNNNLFVLNSEEKQILESIVSKIELINTNAHSLEGTKTFDVPTDMYSILLLLLCNYPTVCCIYCDCYSYLTIYL